MTNNKLIWFRSDLRLLDNPALHHAFQNVSTSAGTGSATPPPALIALYVLSPAEWKAHDVSPVKIDFVLRNLQCLSATLWKNLRIPLLIRHASTAKHVHQVVVDVVQQYGISDIYWNAEYEVNERRRDEAVKKLLTNDQRSLHVHQFDDQCVVLPGLLRSKSSNSAYTVYSPFKKSWFELVRNGRGNYLNVFPVPQRSADALKVVEGVLEALSLRGPDTVPDKVDGFEVAGGLEMKNLLSEDWPAGEDEALKRLQAFGEQKGLANYKDARDIPSQPGTSRLSAYLACGVISAKKCVVKAVEFNGGKLDSGTLGIVTWIQEIIWRDFYRQILVAYPRVCMNRPFKLDTEKVAWRFDETEFKAWCEGKTGYPIVDAGMRQLNQTGWMHNRVRMIVASFLTKHLLHNWMLGEKYFMEHLIDGDFVSDSQLLFHVTANAHKASNNGGWQWAASTGTDAQPYFRVFNPLLQSKRFDPKGDYIKKYVPELRSLKSVDAIHDPAGVLGKKKTEALGYFCRIVDHDKARKRAIEAFQVGKKRPQEDSTDSDDSDKPKKVSKKK